MRRVIIALCLLFVSMSAVEVAAQQVVKKRIGVYKEDGNVVVSEAVTTLVVDLEVECEEVVVGPYARYAQRLLGSRAMLAGRVDYTLTAAHVSVLDESMSVADSDVLREECVESDLCGSVSIDRLSATDVTLEAAAEAAAEQIYELRQARLDLITGELGDGVYGAGLESALREIERLEQGYLELFYGRRTVTVTTHRIVLPVDASLTNYIIARFSPTDGLLASDDLSGDIVMLNITPSNMSYPAGDENGKVAYRYANNATVDVATNRGRLSSCVLPIYEFGQTVMYVMPR